LREYLLIGLRRGMPWRVLAFDNWGGVLSKEKLQAIFKYEINHENITTTQKNMKNWPWCALVFDKQ